VAWLDSVRGLAALSVIGSHYVNSYDLPCRGDVCNRLLSNTPLHVWWDGGAAVSLFFVLSGLVLSLRHFRHGATPDLSRFSLLSYGNFCIGRIFRIWLPYLAVLALSVPLYQHWQAVAASLPSTIPKQNGWLDIMWGRPAGWADFFKDSFLLGWRMDMVYLPQAWTLSIELALSLLVPPGLFLVARGSRWLLAGTLAAILLLHASPYLFHFMLGILLAKYHDGLGRWLREHTFARCCGFGLGFFLYTIGETLGDDISAPVVASLTGLGSGLLLLAAFGSDSAQGLLSLSGFRMVGKVSFSIYLIHFAVLFSVTPPLLAWLNASPAGFYAAWWLGFGANLAVSIGIAGLSYRLIEVPSMALGKRLGRKIQG
jgi:peptidoglycan/LPS O-acetylase OafA/YrhL